MAGQLVKLDGQEAGKIWYKISTYEGSMYAVWKQDCLNNRAFYFGHQATKAEIDAIQAKGQYYIVINKIRKAIRGMAGMLSSSVPKYKLMPVGEDDVLKAAMGTRLLDWVSNNSGGVYTFRRKIKDAMIDNIKYSHVVNSKDGRIKSLLLSFDEVLVDPSSKDPMFQDAEMIIIKRYVPIEYVKSVYGVADVVSEVPTSYYDYYNVDSANAALNNYADEFIQRVFSADKLYVNIYECYRKNYYMEEGFIQSSIVKDTVIGFQHAFREQLPKQIKDFPIIPLYVEDTENPYKRGEIHFLKDLQRFINKTYGVVLLNAQLMSNPKVFVRETDIPNADLDEFKTNYANPGSVNVITGMAEPPTVVQGQPLNQAFFTMYQDAKLELEAATIPAQLMGMYKPEMPTSHLLDQKESLLDSYKDFTSMIDLSCQQEGKVILQYCSAYLSRDKLLHLLDTSNAKDRLATYKQRGIDVDNEQALAAWVQQQREEGTTEEELQQTISQAKLDSDFLKSLEFFTELPTFEDLDITIIPGSYTPTYEMAMLRLMIELTQQGAVDPSIILRYAPVENRQELIERFDMINQLKGQIMNKDEQIETLQGALDSTEKKLVSERVNSESSKAMIRIEKQRAEEKVKALMRKYEHKLNTREQQIKFQNELANLILEVRLSQVEAKEDKKENHQEDAVESAYF